MSRLSVYQRICMIVSVRTLTLGGGTRQCITFCQKKDIELGCMDRLWWRGVTVPGTKATSYLKLSQGFG